MTVPRPVVLPFARRVCATILLLAGALLAGLLHLLAQGGQNPGPYPIRFSRPGDQLPPGRRGAPNLHVLSHLPLGGYLHVADVEIEQELSRPFA